MRKDHKKYARFTENLKTLMKRWDLSNRKMAELLDMNASNVDTLRRSVTQPSVTVILRLESLTAIPAKSLFENEIPYNHFPPQPFLKENIAEEPPGQPYIGVNSLTEMPMADFFQHIEQLTITIAELKKDFEDFRKDKS